MKRVFSCLAITYAVFCLAGCCTTEKLRKEYGPIESAVRNVELAVYGNYPSGIPRDFTADSLMALLLHSERFSEHALLKDYRLVLTPLDGYYLLLVYDGDKLLLFDYNCTHGIVDGALYRNNLRYFLEHTPCEPGGPEQDISD